VNYGDILKGKKMYLMRWEKWYS